jgi:hypothetical protein
LTIPIEEILEDLEVSRAEPGPGYLERLFLRFIERVPFESASKIRANARIAAPEARLRIPEIFWRERLAEGAGGTCFARVAAFDALLRQLGFTTRQILGKVRTEFDHVALLVSAGGREWIADVGFPLPVLLPSAAGRTDTGMGPLSVSASARGWAITFEDGVPETTRSIELFDAPVSQDEFRARWEATFRPDARFLREVLLRRQYDARSVGFASGEIRIDDRHSRTRIPLAPPRSSALAELFGLDAGLLEQAFAIAGDPDSDLESAQVTVALEALAGADAAWAAIRSPEAWSRLFAGVGEVATERTGPSAWRVNVAGPSGATEITEEIEADDSHRSARVRRSGVTSFWEVSESGGKTWFLRRAVLDGPRLDLLRNDSLRGRLAGTLALDLLAWARGTVASAK